MKMKYIKKNIIQFHKIFNEKKFGKLSAGSLVYLILRVFLSENRIERLNKVQNLAYKALERSPWLGRKLIQAYGVFQFLIEFEKWLSRCASYKSENRIHCRMDRSSTGEHYGKKIPGLKRLHDYVKNCWKKTHHIEVLLLSIGDKDFIVDFVLIKYDKNQKKKSKQEKEMQGYSLVVKMLKKLLSGLGKHRQDFIKHARLSFDGWYGKEKMFEELFLLGLNRTVIKSGGVGKVVYKKVTYRLNDLKTLLKGKRTFKTFKECHGLGSCEYLDEDIHFEKSGLKIRAVLIRYKGRKKLKDRYLLLLTNCPRESWHAFQVVQCYKGRWSIEVMFRTCKQIHKLEKYSYHSKDTKNIELHFALCFIGYMWLNWYRIDCTRKRSTKLKDVKNHWSDYLNTMRLSSLKRLFSGL